MTHHSSLKLHHSSSGFILYFLLLVSLQEPKVDLSHFFSQIVALSYVLPLWRPILTSILALSKSKSSLLRVVFGGSYWMFSRVLQLSHNAPVVCSSLFASFFYLCLGKDAAVG